MLEEALNVDKETLRYIEKDREWNPYRDDPDFQQLLATYT